MGRARTLWLDQMAIRFRCVGWENGEWGHSPRRRLSGRHRWTDQWAEASYGQWRWADSQASSSSTPLHILGTTCIIYSFQRNTPKTR